MDERQEATLGAAMVLWRALLQLLQDPAVRLAFGDFAWERGVFEVPYANLQEWVERNAAGAGAEVTLDLALELPGVRVRLVGVDPHGQVTLHLTDAPSETPVPAKSAGRQAAPVVAHCHLPAANVGASTGPDRSDAVGS